MTGLSLRCLFNTLHVAGAGDAVHQVSRDGAVDRGAGRADRHAVHPAQPEPRLPGGIRDGVGAACADAIYGLLGALGIAGIVTAFPMLTVGLKIGGGAFLVWLAWTIARQAPAASTRSTRPARPSCAIL